MCFWLLMTSVLQILLIQIFARPKKRMSQGPGVFRKIQIGTLILIGIIHRKYKVSPMLLKTLYSKELYRHRGGKRSQFCSSM